MSDPTWKQATTPTSTTEARAALFQACVDQGCTVSGWPSSAPQRALVEGDARALAYETSLRAALAKTASPTTCAEAGDSWVDAVVGWFDLDNGFGGKGRIPATKAQWDVPLVVSPSAAPLVIDASSTIQLQASDGTIFESAQGIPVTLNAASSYKGTARFIARKVGTSGNVLAGQIVKVISGPAGLDVDAAGTQALVRAARDQETSAAYIKRGIGRWGTLGAGWTPASFDYLIPTLAPTVTRWSVRDDNPLGPGTVAVALANAAGPALPFELFAVQAGLGARNVKSLGSSTLFVGAASTHALGIAAVLDTDGSNSSAAAQASAALLALAAAFPLGIATLTVDLVRAVLMGVPIETATIPAGSGSAVITLNLPGFTSVEKIASLSLLADEAIGDAEVLTITPSISVT